MDYHLKEIKVMAELNEAYKEHLGKIAEAIQGSEQFATFIDTEEEEDYKALQEYFEPAIEELYNAVAEAEPLQLRALEEQLLNDDFAGLYLPKALGFTILRGQLDANYKYVQSQDHFRNILLFICNSPNFDILKNRIGQSIQVGFSLSSDIWITNILKDIQNKRVKWWLQNQKLSELRDILNRKSSYLRYKRQFKSYNYLSTEFPGNAPELKIIFGSLKDFLMYRISNNLNNASIYPPYGSVLVDEKMKGTAEHTYLLGLFLNFMELNKEYEKALGDVLNDERKNNPNFNSQYFDFLLNMHENKVPALNMDADRRFMELLDIDIEDEIKALYDTLKVVHNKGYINEEVMAVVKRYHESHEGLSENNEAIRQSILVYIRVLMENLEETDYSTWFDMHKVFASYMKIFGNEQFNQSIKELYLKYLRRLLKKYTDKRGGDYQGVKKFTTATFKECNFMKEKDIKELFKTKRKKKPTPSRP